MEKEPQNSVFFLTTETPERFTQNPFEVNLTILGVKIGHDHK
jgi:hypothetical protein